MRSVFFYKRGLFSLLKGGTGKKSNPVEAREVMAYGCKTKGSVRKVGEIRVDLRKKAHLEETRNIFRFRKGDKPTRREEGKLTSMGRKARKRGESAEEKNLLQPTNRCRRS